MLIWLLLVSFAGSCVAPIVSRLTGRWAGWVLGLLPAGLFVSLIAIAPVMERGWVLGDGRNWAPGLGLYLTFRLDGFSFLMTLLITGIGALVVVYSGDYMMKKPANERARFFTLILLFMTSMLGAVLADNMLVMLMFWEATSILSFLLIGFDSRSARARRSALMSLHVTGGGGLALLAAVILIGQTLGTYSLGEVRERIPELAASPLVTPILICILLGAFTKSAQFPFYFWLPNAMQAPTPASAYLHSATMVKLGIYLLARFEPLIATVPWGRSVLIGVGTVTMAVAALQALRAEGFKTALAYSTIASLGIMVTMIGMTGPTATVAMVGFLFSHALYKAALFFCAGTVLHVTGLQTLRAMGGMAQFLPLTALATVLASLSMAGLPPFFGFISKEFLFQAQIEGVTDWIPLLIAVIVNAVMVGVAAVITLRPFFLGSGKVKEVKDGETPGLVLGPMVLSLAGLILSLAPDWITRNVLRPAVVAVYGNAVEVNVQLWHGLTPMLLLSGVVVVIGALIAFFWRPLHVRLRGNRSFDRYGVENWYDWLLTALGRSAHAITGLVQHGDLRRYLYVVWAMVPVFVCGAWLAAWQGTGMSLRWPEFGDFRPAAAGIALIGAGGAIAAVWSRGLLSALVAVGLVGLSVALAFLLNGAPDLALTQFTVEALMVVLLTILLLAVPLAGPLARSRGEMRFDLLVSIVVGLVVFVSVMDMLAGENSGLLRDYFGEQTWVGGHGRNVVNVILVDFRGFDTLGETVVIAMAAVFGWSLLGPARGSAAPVPAPRDVPFALRMTARGFFWLLLVLSVWILLRGHDQPGGGFIGGLVASLAFAMIALGHGIAAARKTLRFHPVALVGAGIGLALLGGLPGLFAEGHFLTHLWYFGPPMKLSTTMLFDFGVYVTVTGAVLAYMFGLQREARQ
ncbi:MAG: hydrogen gas-evolving membrane-bound hydrogenase subunit E [Sphingomonadaceae bacterium]